MLDRLAFLKGFADRKSRKELVDALLHRERIHMTQPRGTYTFTVDELPDTAPSTRCCCSSTVSPTTI